MEWACHRKLAHLIRWCLHLLVNYILVLKEFVHRFWPDYVRQRVRDTYAYFGGSIGITALTAFTVFNTPILLNIVSKNSIMVYHSFTCWVIICNIQGNCSNYSGNDRKWNFSSILAIWEGLRNETAGLDITFFHIRIRDCPSLPAWWSFSAESSMVISKDI